MRWITTALAGAAVAAALGLGLTAAQGSGGGTAPSAGTVAPLVVSHRGYKGTGCAENTACSARAAVQAGADMVETDVRWTRDGVPIILHDATVDRTTTGHGRVDAMTAAQYRALHTRAGRGRPATVRELITAAQPLTTLAELKTVPTPPQWAAFQRAIPPGVRGHVLIQSFHARALDVAARDGYRVMRLAERPVSHPTVAAYALHYTRLSARTIARLHAYGTQVYAWTPDTPTDWTRLARAGVDGLITDADPRAVARALRPGGVR